MHVFTATELVLLEQKYEPKFSQFGTFFETE